MGKLLFACDMDNTLIHSHRYRQEGDICVELYEGREQSFMSPRAVELLTEVMDSGRIDFLPVTTRSVAQFSRIEFPRKVKQALTANGTILLRGGQADDDWRNQSLRDISTQLPEMERLLGKYSADGLFRTVKIVDGMFLFAACESAEGVPELTERLRTETSLSVECTGRKIYWFPPLADKGTALERYSRLNGYDCIAAAGDSPIDASMLNIGQVAFVPDRALAGRLTTADVRICGNENFAEYILKHVLGL